MRTAPGAWPGSWPVRVRHGPGESFIKGIGLPIPGLGIGDVPLFAGPIIAREVLTAPRPPRFYVARAAYVGLLFVLMWTSWQVLIGFREVREFGVIARFGGILFQIFVLVQLTLRLFFAPLEA